MSEWKEFGEALAAYGFTPVADHEVRRAYRRHNVCGHRTSIYAPEDNDHPGWDVWRQGRLVARGAPGESPVALYARWLLTGDAT
jgi:hypothetical protein